MSKAVLLSIRPRWCGMIASGKKTIEVRKTRPKIDTPFKCYIYQTLPKYGDWNDRDGRVIGEFVCDGIYKSVYKVDYGMDEEGWYSEWDVNEDCLTDEEIDQYAGADTDVLYGWHISELVIYDEPIELSQFLATGECKKSTRPCNCSWFTKGSLWGTGKCDLESSGFKPLTRPPQSWCYVEELTEVEK